MVQSCRAGCHDQRSYHLPGLMEVQSSRLGWFLFTFPSLLVKNAACIVHGGKYCSDSNVPPVPPQRVSKVSRLYISTGVEALSWSEAKVAVERSSACAANPPRELSAVAAGIFR